MDARSDKNRKNNNMLAGAIILIIIVLGVAYFLYSGSSSIGTIQNTTFNRSSTVSVIGSIQNRTNNSSTTINNSTTNKTQQKFSSSSIYNYAHLVAQNPYNSSINYIAAGAKISESNMANGSVSIDVTEISDNQSKIVVLSKGESLYYSDLSYADDIFPSGEYSTLDDGLVVVNAQGYIANQTTV